MEDQFEEVEVVRETKARETDAREVEAEDWMEERIEQLLFGTQESSISPNNLYDDLEMFPVGFSKLDRTRTAFGRVCLKGVLRGPSADPVALEARQELVKLIRENELMYVTEPLEGLEKGPLALWDDLDEEGESLLELVYFNLPLGERVNGHLNAREDALLVNTYYNILGAPILTALGPLLSVLIPLIFLKVTNWGLPVFSLVKLAFRMIFKLDVLMALPWKTRLATLVGMATWFLFYLYSVFTAYNSAKHIHSTVNIFHRRIRSVARFCQTVDSVYKQTSPHLPFGDDALEDSLARFQEMFASPCLHEEPRLFNNKGAILTTYRRLSEARELLLPLFAYVANLDAFCSISRLVDEGYCFPKYLTGTSVELRARLLWHPILGPSSRQNSVTVKRNLIVTGPNAGGKSTFIKSLAMAVLLGQTIGLAPARKLAFTPFERINSYANIADVEGTASLFQAEMRRCHQHLESIKDGKKTFMIIDEMFSSTNYNEGLAGAFAVTKRLIQYENSMSIVTTHFTPLAQGLVDNDAIKAVCFNAIKCEDGSIRFPYRLEEGVSDQYIALDLLRLDGYDPDIIADALEISQRVRLSLEPEAEAEESVCAGRQAEESVCASVRSEDCD